jgi:serine phosphatase RsbU (regulator of sigma subunit)
MGVLITIQGPELGRSFTLADETTTLGRQHDSDICLSGQAISRHHAQIVRRDDNYFLVDLDSSNGTYLNGAKVAPMTPMPLAEGDQVRIGPYLLSLRLKPAEPSFTIRESVTATSAPTPQMLGPEPAAKLRTILEITQHLTRALDVDQLFEKLLQQLLQLFPQSDRGLVILSEGNNLIIRGQLCRHLTDATALPFSRTIVKQALDQGVGLLSDDVKLDQRFQSSATVTSLDTTSMMCVPMITQEGKRLGVIQLDRRSRGFGFGKEDLTVLAAVAAQVTVVLENVNLQAERVKQEVLRKELAMAREIQQGFLPAASDGELGAGFEIHGQVFPARQVAGDFYDFFPLPDGRIAFFLGDVSGKGMPAALFMVAVRTLCRHLARTGENPARSLERLNDDLADDNPACMFVTLIHGIYEPATGGLVVTSAGHPAPLLRRANGSVEELPLSGGRLLGYPGQIHLPQHRVTLMPGDLLFAYTDGVLEARLSSKKIMFGVDRIKELLRDYAAHLKLDRLPPFIKKKLQDFTGIVDLQDDVTLLMLRRQGAGNVHLLHASSEESTLPEAVA